MTYRNVYYATLLFKQLLRLAEESEKMYPDKVNLTTKYIQKNKPILNSSIIKWSSKITSLLQKCVTKIK